MGEFNFVVTKQSRKRDKSLATVLLLHGDYGLLGFYMELDVYDYCSGWGVRFLPSFQNSHFLKKF